MKRLNQKSFLNRSLIFSHQKLEPPARSFTLLPLALVGWTCCSVKIQSLDPGLRSQREQPGPALWTRLETRLGPDRNTPLWRHWGGRNRRRRTTRKGWTPCFVRIIPLTYLTSLKPVPPFAHSLIFPTSPTSLTGPEKLHPGCSSWNSWGSPVTHFSSCWLNNCSPRWRSLDTSRAKKRAGRINVNPATGATTLTSRF